MAIKCLGAALIEELAQPSSCDNIDQSPTTPSSSILRQVGRFGYFKVIAEVSKFLWDDLAVALILCLAILRFDKEFAKAIGPELLLPILGIAISVFTSFRNSQAYGRWWEARTLWGSLVNESRNWRNSLYTLLGNGQKAEALIRPLLERHVLLIWTINNELRRRPHAHTTKAIAQLAAETNNQNATSQELFLQQSLAIQLLFSEQSITDFSRLQLMKVQDDITNSLGGLERIRNEPLPSSYDVFIRLSVWAFGILLFMRIAAAYQAFGAITGFLIMAGFITAERLGAYIEQPFAEPSLSLPMNRLCSVITNNLLGSSHPLATPPENEQSTIWT